VDEAKLALDAGVDVLVAQGVEAGGHVRGTAPLEELLAGLLEVAGTVPVVAAGGIATGADAALWLEKGAAAVWVGTRFLCSAEARVHPTYQSAIISARENATYYGEVFTGGWENAPHRVLRNTTVNAWLWAGGPPPGRRPGEGETVAWSPSGAPVERYADVIPVSGSTGDVEALALYAGTGSSRIDGIQPANEIVGEFRAALACQGAGLDRPDSETSGP
ncbi:MAG: nitronate monooxygenase, partial [Acidobacteriota bacterium]